MAQQTAVAWLIMQLPVSIRIELYEQNIHKQAKEKHKEETMDAFQAGKWDWAEHSNNNKHSKDPAEYYNETFKKN